MSCDSHSSDRLVRKVELKTDGAIIIVETREKEITGWQMDILLMDKHSRRIVCEVRGSVSLSYDASPTLVRKTAKHYQVLLQNGSKVGVLGMTSRGGWTLEILGR